jgi:hypothetical protein
MCRDDNADAVGLPACRPLGEAWLSAPRFVVYLAATGADRDRALALYEWDAQLSAQADWST